MDQVKEKRQNRKTVQALSDGAFRARAANGQWAVSDEVTGRDRNRQFVKGIRASSSWAEKAYAKPVSEKISIIKKGISKKELETVKEESDLDYDTLSNILSVSKAKLHGKKGTEKFDQNTSERIMLLADVIAYGQHVFEDKEAFNEWLKTTSMALGNKTPLALMDTIYGIEEVKKEIGRIEYGVF